jgi:hypothetical protein
LERNAIDIESPLSFSKFNSVVSYFFGGDVKAYYDSYIKAWNAFANNKDNVNKEDIINRYKNFIKEIALSYSTIEEEDYLSKIDYDDPLYLEASIPFFAKKIEQISKYYRDKREDVKNQPIKNKIVGTSLGVKNVIREFTLNYIENLPDAPIKYDLANIREFLTVEIDEFFDTYPTYFDQEPDEKVYDYKDFDYGLDIFLKADDVLIDEVFGDVSEELRELKELNKLFELKRRETRKYMGSDFYFLSTGDTSTTFLSGKLFDSHDPIKNLFNQNHPTTATTPKKKLKSVDDIGFFKPQKSSIILLDGDRSNFQIDTSKLSPNSLYYFSDPLQSGNSNFLEIIIDVKGLKKNSTSSMAASEPLISKNDATFHGYYSETYLDGEQRYFQEVFDRGYIKDLKKDVYGNIYGLFSNDNNFKLNIDTAIENEKTVKSLILNGHTFYDNLYGEGLGFDYTVVDNQPTNFTTRSGLSSNTGDFSELSGRYTLFGRYFTPYNELSYPRNDIQYDYYDGGFIFSGNDPVSSDLDEFPGNDLYYYTLLLEAGVHTTSPLQRALNDPLFPSLTADATQSFIPDDVNTFGLDGGRITDDFVFDYSFQTPNYYYDDTVLNGSIMGTIIDYDVDSFISRRNLAGVVFVKNISTGKVDTLTNSIPYLSSIYNTQTLSDFNDKVVRFEVVGDVLSLETDNYFTIFKIGYDGDNFINPKNSPIVHTINATNFNVMSERFAHNGNVFYNKLTSTTPLSNVIEFDLNFYSFNVKNFTQRLIKAEKFSLSGGDIAYSNLSNPTLTYKTSLDTFNMSTILKDQNHLFDILDINYKTAPYKINHIKVHKNQSESFSNLVTTTLNILSSQNTTSPEPYLIVL